MAEVVKIKSYEELGLSDDFLFCKIMQSNPDLCKELAELVLSRKIGKIISIDKQKPIEITRDGKGVRFDVYMEDDASTVYDIEMQTTRSTELPKRMRYYQSMIDLNLIERGSQYKELKKSYIIFICLENPYAESGLHKYSIKSVCEEDPSLDFRDDIHKIILSARGDRQDVSEGMMSFLSYLTDRKPGSDFTKRLEEKVVESRSHEKWRLEYMTLLERDERMREEGREQGRQEERVKTEAARKEAAEAKAEAEKARAVAKEARTKAEEARTEAKEARTKAEEARTKEAEAREFTVKAIRKIMDSQNISAREAMDGLGIPLSEHDYYMKDL